MEFEFSEQAEHDLDALVAFYLERGIDVAHAFADEFERLVERLHAFPGERPTRRKGDSPGVDGALPRWTLFHGWARSGSGVAHPSHQPIPRRMARRAVARHPTALQWNHHTRPVPRPGGRLAGNLSTRTSAFQQQAERSTRIRR